MSTPSRPFRSARRERWLLAAPLITLVVVVTAGVVRERVESPSAPVASSAPSAAPSVVPSSPVVSAPPGLTTEVAAPVVQAEGRIPARGSGTFVHADGRGPVLGSKGSVRRFRVAVEQGANEDVAAFAERVERILGDRRSWIGNGRVRLQRVSGGDPADFTVYLATRETAGDICRRGGTDIWVGEHPYTSCRTTGHVVINLDRWRLSAGPYVKAKAPLEEYRRYVINHEVGHELGEGHQGCPRRGGPAPVMVQQTLSLRGCVPYAWPRRGNRPLTGPRVS